MKQRVLAEADWYRFDRAVNEYVAFIEEIVNPGNPEIIVLEPEKVGVKS